MNETKNTLSSPIPQSLRFLFKGQQQINRYVKYIESFKNIKGIVIIFIVEASLALKLTKFIKLNIFGTDENTDFWDFTG